jgi:hypothetical protein
MLDEPVWRYLVVMPVCKKGGGREEERGRRRIWSEESFHIMT